MSKPLHSLFVYGSLLSPEVLRRVVGRKIASHPGRLHEYACYYVDGATFPGMISERGASVLGEVLTGLTDSELAALDAYEDDFYVRSFVEVVTEAGLEKAMAYVIPVKNRWVLSGRRWVWQEFEQRHLEGYLARMRESVL